MPLSTRIRDHICSNVVGYVALFMAMTGVSYAASVGSSEIQRNAVRSKHIKTGNVKTSDVAPDAIGSPQVAANSLTGDDVNEGSLDSSVLQARVTDNCLAGSSIRQIAADGQVTCEIDDAGSGPATDLQCTNCVEDSEVSNTLTASDLVAGSAVVSDAEVSDNLTISGGSVADGSLSPNVALLDNSDTFSGIPAFNGGTNGVASPFTVDSSFLVSNLNADLLDGQSGSSYQNATNLSSGTVADARLSSNVPLLNASNTFTAANSFATGVTLPTLQFTPQATAPSACNAGGEGRAYYDNNFSGAPTPDEGLVTCNGTSYVWVGDGTTSAD